MSIVLAGAVATAASGCLGGFAAELAAAISSGALSPHAASLVLHGIGPNTLATGAWLVGYLLFFMVVSTWTAVWCVPVGIILVYLGNRQAPWHVVGPLVMGATVGCFISSLCYFLLTNDGRNTPRQPYLLFPYPAMEGAVAGAIAFLVIMRLRAPNPS